MNAPAPSDSPPPPSLPLARLLNHAADAVQAVRAGRSLNAALAACPAAARPGAQALSFHALRWLGAAQALRAQLAPKAPAPAVDALLLTALALLWPAAESRYSEHTLVDQAVDAARQRAKQSAAFVNAVLRRFLRERDALVEAALREAHEELGINARDVTVIGTSDVYRTGSGYAITPVIAVVPPDLQLNPSPTEVAAWFEAPVDFVFDTANHTQHSAHWQGAERRYIEILWQEHRIWGVTAGIIANLARRIAW